MTDLHELYEDQYRGRPQHDLDAAKGGARLAGGGFAPMVIVGEIQAGQPRLAALRDAGVPVVCSVGTSGEVPAHAAQSPLSTSD